MKINKLHLKCFRNYDDLKIDFNDNLNIIIGNNAQGKTNILEAIYILSITKSNLTVNEKNCIRNGNLFFKIDGQIATNDGVKRLSVLLNNEGKKIEINGNEVKKYADYVGNLKIIDFNPNNIYLIKDTPGNRRKFLNIEISQLYNKYLNVLNEYNAILKQRNEYLKIIRDTAVNKIYLDILNNKMVDLGVMIYDYRISFINNLNKYINELFEKISGYNGLTIDYIPNISFDKIDDIKQNYLAKLNENYDKEVLYGNTIYGPHRDDFALKLDDKDLFLFGSQGQQKLAVLALKLAEISVFYDICGEYPVVLLDDLFSELDLDKRNKLINYLNMDIQVIVTTTDLNNIEDKFLEMANVYVIDKGKVIG